MTPEKTAVKGSHWFIFHGKRDAMNSKLRGTRGRAVYRFGKATAAQAGTADGRTAVSLLALSPGAACLAGPRLRKGVCIHCRRMLFKGPGAYMMGMPTVPV